MALFWRIWVAVTLVNFAVLTVFVGLATLQFGNINSDLVGERLVVLAGRTAAPFEAAAKIGLPLSTVRNADALLERARQTDDAIVAIHVFDAAGRVVHSTAEPPPAAISGEALDARRDSKGTAWHRETSEGFLSSIGIASRTGESAGGILIVYPKAGSLIQIRAMAAELTLAAVAVLLVSAAFSALLLRLGLRRQIDLFERFDTAIVDFERGAWRGAAGKPAVPTGAVPVGDLPAGEEGGDLRDLLATSERRYVAAGRALAAARDGTS
jgi:hypothetical protein